MNTQPGPGLGVRLPGRTWATRHVVAACTVTLVAGMMIGYGGKKPTAGGGAARPIVALGGLTSPAPAGGTAPTTVPAGTTATTATTAATATTATTGSVATDARPTVLMANTPGRGPSDLPTFTSEGPWSIGWHFRCVSAPGGSGTFTLQVVADPSDAATPAVEQTSREAQGITPETAPGRQHLKVITDPACQWAVKITGLAP